MINFILEHCRGLVAVKNFISQVDQYWGKISRLFNPMDLIEISSSDSDFDWGDDDAEDVASPSVPSVASTSTRTLPNWSSTSGTSTRVDGIRAQQQASSRRDSNNNFRSSEGHQFFNGARAQPSNSHFVSVNDNSRSRQNGGAVHSAATNGTPNSSGGGDREHGQAMIQQSAKRMLPPSCDPSLPRPRPFISRDSEVSNEIIGNGRNQQLLMPTGLTNRNNRKDDDIGMLDSRNRVLPQSLSYGRPSSSYHGAQSATGDDRISGPDERFVYQAALQDLSQPRVEANLPDGLLSVPLLRHQKIALAWMLTRESRIFCVGGILADDQGLGKTISTIALIQMQRYSLLNAKSEEQSNHKAVNLDDDDDHHNTGDVAVLDDESTSGANVQNIQETLKPDLMKQNKKASSSRQASERKRQAAGTLVVCPATVLRQWARELEEKVGDEGRLKVLIYHGGNRTRDPSELAKYDVVLTTYAIITNEVPKQPLVDEEDSEQKNGERYGISSEFSSNKKRKRPSETSKKGKKGKIGKACFIDGDCGPIARVVWFRVVLDEAQTIKNHRTQAARACCGLRAKKRWCLSGTPIQNSIDELYSYFRFLRYDPYAAHKAFIEGIKVPIARDSQYGYKKLQAVLKAVMLRRKKDTLLDGNPIINLPPKIIEMKRVNFTSEERSFYNRLEAESRSQFKAYAAAGTVHQNYANILLMLLRLRQACDHPVLAQGFSSGLARRTSMETAKRLSDQELMRLLDHLERSAICRACDDTPEDAVVTKCGHVFCYQCVADICSIDDNTCPVPRCRGQLSVDVTFSEDILRSCLSRYSDSGATLQHDENSAIVKPEFRSSKIKAALEILQSLCKSSPCTYLDGLAISDGKSSLWAEEEHGVKEEMKISSLSKKPNKAIVFSQWTRMLDLFEFCLNESCIQYRRLDGTMSLVSRDRAVREFNTDPEVSVMLMSLKAGNLGLNMVAACHVILLDLWWNPTTEDQAIDRAHRIGQTRPVTVSRITIEGTVEDRILDLQEEKRKLVASAFGEDYAGGRGARLTVDDLRYLFMGRN